MGRLSKLINDCPDDIFLGRGNPTIKAIEIESDFQVGIFKGLSVHPRDAGAQL